MSAQIIDKIPSLRIYDGTRPPTLGIVDIAGGWPTFAFFAKVGTDDACSSVFSLVIASL